MQPWMVQAARQHGVISTAELRRFGSPRTWEQRITAAVRWGGAPHARSVRQFEELYRDLEVS